MKKALIIASMLCLGTLQAKADTLTEVPITPELESQAKILDDSVDLEDNESLEMKIKLMESLMNRTNAKDDSLRDLINEMEEEEQVNVSSNNESNVRDETQSITAFRPSEFSAKQLTSQARPVIAARRASRTAHSRSKGLCARYVRKALQSAGYSFSPNGSAYQYATRGTLRQAGFTKISNNSTPQVGDVVVISRSRAHPHGHISIFDGRSWVSDFRQSRKSPYSKHYPYSTWRDSSHLNDASSKGMYMANR